MDLGLTGRVAIVGGASSGLGLAVAERLASEGCRLALFARRGEALERAAAAIRATYGGEVVPVSADASAPDAAERIASTALEAFGAVDIVVLNAGGPPPVDPLRTDPDEWRRAFQLLALTPIELASRLLPGMRERRWGRIVAILSYVVRQPVPDLVYSTSGRSALVGWLKTAARAVAADGVTINGVLPGPFETPRIVALDRARAEREGRSVDEVRAESVRAIPAGRYGRPAELAAYVSFLCSDLAAFQTGTFTPVDGGLLAGLP
ncbi:MAG TPA: SDR family oxidoreductase [Candidatus Limnocylindrales bacterium]|nr:SDR family oxidoreductase [Candidatus Limnocylindrales bacterium]